MTDVSDAERRISDLWDTWRGAEQTVLLSLDKNSNLPRWCIDDLHNTLKGIPHSFWLTDREGTVTAGIPLRFWEFLESKRAEI